MTLHFVYRSRIMQEMCGPLNSFSPSLPLTPSVTTDQNSGGSKRNACVVKRTSSWTSFADNSAIYRINANKIVCLHLMRILP